MGGHGRAVIERLAAVHLLRPCRRSARRCGGGCGTGHARTTNGSLRGRSTGDAEPGGNRDQPTTAIYITQPNSRKGQGWFLMPKPLAEPGREQILPAQGKSYLIRLKTPQQEFEDCSNSDFDTLSKVD